MPKFAQVRSRDLIKALMRSGFTIDHQTGSHVVLYRDTDRKRAVVPLHVKVIPKGTFAAILREAGISKDELSR